MNKQEGKKLNNPLNVMVFLNFLSALAVLFFAPSTGYGLGQAFAIALYIVIGFITILLKYLAKKYIEDYDGLRDIQWFISIVIMFIMLWIMYLFVL